jgi:tetratricopeptide (TPR) repeat protein
MLAACSTMDGGLDQKKIKEMPVESVMSSSDKAIAAGDNEKALALLDAGAKAYPTSPQPWLKKAQMYFKAANYPSAILAAEEAIQRDPVNEEAKAIALVSSLRIAVKYVSDLRALNDLKGDVRPDAEQLARKLRDTLNATVLVPTGTKEAAAEPEPKSAPIRYRRPPAPRPATLAAPAVEPPPAGSSNPFGSLK